MKRLLSLVVMICITTISCKTIQAQQLKILTTENELAENVGTQVSVRGAVVHVCPVNGKIMKLQLSDGTMMQILPNSDDKRFHISEDEHLKTVALTFPDTDTLTYKDDEWGKKQVTISGRLFENRVSKQHIDSLYNAKILTCHINYEDCKDVNYQKKMTELGKAQASLDKTNAKLYGRMQNSGKDYVVVYTLMAEKAEF